MKLLVIGGSYFLGRVFMIQAHKDFDITVVNRGTYSLEEYGVKQVKGDRRDATVWQQCTEDYDAIIDFCGYKSGDIRFVMDHLSGRVKQYIFISTVDVYQRQNWGMNTSGNSAADIYKTENTELETRLIPGEAGEYIRGKVALEKELTTVCGERDISFSIIRPSIIYGPYNYAPRESVFIQLMVQNKVLVWISDATAKFQCVYVKDVADAIIKCIGNEKAYAQGFNICGEEVLDYHVFADCLKRCAADNSIRDVYMTAKQAEEQGIPLPFPVTAMETELCSNEKFKQIAGMTYTSFEEGMMKTFRAFKHVYE